MFGISKSNREDTEALETVKKSLFNDYMSDY